MNALAHIAVLPDVQSRPDHRALSIEAVGIRDVRCPVTIQSGRRPQATIATFSMSVGLAAATKGTHMSRFIELLDSQAQPLDQLGFKKLLFEMLARLDARSGEIEMRFSVLVHCRHEKAGHTAALISASR
jgi:GTP cyclohydrolase FolE2